MLIEENEILNSTFDKFCQNRCNNRHSCDKAQCDVLDFFDYLELASIYLEESKGIEISSWLSDGKKN